MAGQVKATYGTGSSVMGLIDRPQNLDPGLCLTIGWQKDWPAYAAEGNIRATGASLHFFSIHGKPIQSSFDAHVTGITLAQLRQVPRVMAVAGGRRKLRALISATRTGLLGVLITGCFTAARLLDASETGAEQTMPAA